jgi:hypothetical protein
VTYLSQLHHCVARRREISQAPVSEAIGQESFTTTRGFHAFNRAALPLSSRTLTFVSGIIRRHRKSIGPRWRKLNSGRRALLVFAYLHKGETFAELATGFGLGRPRHDGSRRRPSSCSRPAPRSFARRRGTRRRRGYAYVVLDGTLIPIDQVAAGPAVLFRQVQEAWHEPASHRQPYRERPMGCPGRCPARFTTRRPSESGGVLAELEAAGPVVLADKGYQGAAHAKVLFAAERRSLVRPWTHARDSRSAHRLLYQLLYGSLLFDCFVCY